MAGPSSLHVGLGVKSKAMKKASKAGNSDLDESFTKEDVGFPVVQKQVTYMSAREGSHTTYLELKWEQGTFYALIEVHLRRYWNVNPW